MPRFSGFNPHLRKLPKQEGQPIGTLRESWWTKPEYQNNREAFQKKLVDDAVERMNRSRFGGSKRYHDSGLGEVKNGH